MSYVTHPIPARAGIGLRAEHFDCIIDHIADIAWLEIHPENYFSQGGQAHRVLDAVRAHTPVSFHGVGMSLGSVDEIAPQYLQHLKALIARYEPALVSDHISWSSFGGQYFNDLLPLPYDEETLNHLRVRIDYVQNQLKRQILVENASTYLQFTHEDLSEPEFLNRLSRESGCGLLLDVNNIFVNCENHRLDADDFLQKIDFSLVQEIHLAGHTCKQVNSQTIRIDTHNDVVCDQVWALYDQALKLAQKPVATLIEWDSDLPPISTLIEQADIAQRFLNHYNEPPVRTAKAI